MSLTTCSHCGFGAHVCHIPPAQPYPDIGLVDAEDLVEQWFHTLGKDWTTANGERLMLTRDQIVALMKGDPP